MAQKHGDDEFADQCRKWFKAGSDAIDEHLWTGSYYQVINKLETDETSDLVFGYQLDGQWIAQFHGVGDVLPKDRVRTTLDTIGRCNVAQSGHGAVNYSQPDAKPAKIGGYGAYSYFPPEVLMLAMTYMYDGDKAFGLELAQRCWRNIVCRQRRTWDQPNYTRGDIDNGEYVFNHDYYQNMMLWSLPAAIAGEDLTSPSSPGGLVDRMIRAGAV